MYRHIGEELETDPLQIPCDKCDKTFEDVKTKLNILWMFIAVKALYFRMTSASAICYPMKKSKCWWPFATVRLSRPEGALGAGGRPVLEYIRPLDCVNLNHKS